MMPLAEASPKRRKAPLLTRFGDVIGTDCRAGLLVGTDFREGIEDVMMMDIISISYIASVEVFLGERKVDGAMRVARTP